MDEEIKAAVELLNKNEYVVLKISKAQIALAENCKHDKKRCNFNLLGIRCMDLVCVQDAIRDQILPYLPNTDKGEEEQS